MGSLVRELQAVLSVYLGIMVEGSVTGLSAVAIPAILRCSTSTLFRCDSISSTFPCLDNHSEPEDYGRLWTIITIIQVILKHVFIYSLV